MVDTVVAVDAGSEVWGSAGLWGPYWSSTSVGALVYLNRESQGQIIKSARTTNAGVGWTLANINTDDSCYLCCFYEKELGATGAPIIHIWWMEEVNAIVKYASLNVSTGALSSTVTVATVATGTTSSLQHTKMYGCMLRDGSLMIGGTNEVIGTGTPFMYRSTDDGATWGGKTAPHITPGDAGILFPAATVDCGDAALIYWHRGTQLLSVMMYSLDTNLWTETTIETVVDMDFSLTPYNYFDGALRCTDGAIILAASDEVSSGVSNIQTWTILPTTIANPTITAGANVQTAQAARYGISVAVNQQNNDVYVGYVAGTAAYKLSTDDLVTWGSQTVYSGSSSDYRRMSGPRAISALGGIIQWGLYTESPTDPEIHVNLDNDSVLSSGSTACADEVGGLCYGDIPGPGEGGSESGTGIGGWRYIEPPLFRRPVR